MNPANLMKRFDVGLCGPFTRVSHDGKTASYTGRKISEPMDFAVVEQNINDPQQNIYTIKFNVNAQNNCRRNYYGITKRTSPLMQNSDADIFLMLGGRSNTDFNIIIGGDRSGDILNGVKLQLQDKVELTFNRVDRTLRFQIHRNVDTTYTYQVNNIQIQPDDQLHFAVLLGVDGCTFILD
ncbi:hypothetical protein DLAC_06072 [Tieghemostelium lacteum]|uniref:Uncharacterized protein n=1 Tax=Tieghemostelium lacteum TaxID=361077 RepID=A0A151ZHD0_TIELA|nr:hypothetical protein DLAC_06072 [Tieghemostelium lacteum]|eukprot:KYQ93391.1 hypothetical protein DLAC_06072 [Tieghemostelium lacteum]